MGSTDAAELLTAWRNGDRAALDSLLPLVYDELRRLAHAHLRRERSDHTLQTTALVHEAYLRLIGQRHVSWENRAQLLGLAAQMMRRILVNYAEARRAAKRGGEIEKVPIEDAENIAASQSSADVIAVDRALQRLTALDARQGRIVELRYFGGLSVEEAAEVLEISPATVKREWSSARLWLLREVSGTNLES